MKIFHHLEDLEGPCRDGSCMTLGVFDAVHRGHQELIGRARDQAKKLGVHSLVFTFERHPLALLAPVHCPPTLTQPADRAALIEKLGVDLCLLLRFTPEIAEVSAEEFIEKILVGICRIRFLVCGQDFSFGQGGKGDIQLLKEMSASFGYDIQICPSIDHGSSTISSTRIRDLLISGKVSEVVPMLERRYDFTSEVVTGDQRGRQIGFPTANLMPEANQLIPADGVYAVLVEAGGQDNERIYGGMLNIGSRPTFEGAGRSIEVHIFDFSGELVGERIRMEFVERVRDERKFGSVDELVEQLKDDEKTCRRILASTNGG